MRPQYHDWIIDNGLNQTIINMMSPKLAMLNYFNSTVPGAFNKYVVTAITTPTNTTTLVPQPPTMTFTNTPTITNIHIPTTAPVYHSSRYPLGPNDNCTPEEWALDYILKLMRSHTLSLADIAKELQANQVDLLPGEYNLPGGAVLKIATDNSYTIDDSNHKTVHKANPNPDFNEAFCVSEVLEQFMAYVADLKLTKEQFMELPIRLFMLWLIIESCKKDGEPVPEPELKQLELALYPLQPNLVGETAVAV